MHPQLREVVDEFESARDRLRRLALELSSESWARRADPARWSVGECVAHLNLTSEAYLPVLAEGLGRARALGGPAPERHRRDPVGWLLWRTMGPPVRLRVKTAAAFVPAGSRPRDELVEEFERLQEEQIRLVGDADGLPVGKVRVASPFNPRVRYNLFSCFTILPRHQHRHLWQAEGVARALASG